MRSIVQREPRARARLLFGSLVILAFSSGMILIGRGPSALASAIAGALFTVPLCSLGEWLVHGVLYHGRVPGFSYIRKIHHAGHHFALFPPSRYVQAGDYEFMRVRKPLVPFEMSKGALDNAISKWGQVLLHFAVGLPLIIFPAWVFTGSSWFAGASLVTLSLISWLLAHVHGAIHTPRDRWIERMRWFQWLDRHHYIHHIDLSANINFMLPICDLLFGTEKAALTEQEARSNPTFEEAKLLPRS